MSAPSSKSMPLITSDHEQGFVECIATPAGSAAPAPRGGGFSFHPLNTTSVVSVSSSIPTGTLSIADH